MSRLTAFNPDSGPSTGLGAPKKKKKPQEAQRATPRLRLNQVREAQLEKQGVDTQELRRETAMNRKRLQASKDDRVGAARVVRELERSGNVAEAESLRSQLRTQRLSEDAVAYDIADRGSLLRGRLSDLPPEQQIQVRAEGRQRLNDQLPGIAAGAAVAAQTAEDAQLNRLADIGARVFELQSGSQSAEGLSRTELARLAQGASPEVIAQVTNGVGLPADRTRNARDFADRTARLANDGIDFGPNESRTSRLDTDLVSDIIQEQGRNRLSREVDAEVATEAIERRRLSSDNQTLGLNRDASLLNQELTAADLAAATSTASQANIPARLAAEEAQLQQAVAEANATEANARLIEQQIALPQEQGRDALTVEERIDYEIAPRDTLNLIRGGVRNEQTEQSVTTALQQVRSALLTLNPAAAKEYATKMLNELESLKTDDRPLEDGGFRGSFLSNAIDTTAKLSRFNILNPYGILQTGRDLQSLAETENERARGPVVDETYKTIIRELRAAAAG